MAYSSSKKLEIASRLIEQRIPAEMAYRMMGLKERGQVADVVFNQEPANSEHILSDYQRYQPKNTIINNKQKK